MKKKKNSLKIIKFTFLLFLHETLCILKKIMKNKLFIKCIASIITIIYSENNEKKLTCELNNNNNNNANKKTNELFLVGEIKT